MKIRTINHVGLPIKDRKAAFKFYRDILGLEIIPSMVDNENIVWMKAADGTMVHLIEPPARQEGRWLPLRIAGRGLRCGGQGVAGFWIRR